MNQKSLKTRILVILGISNLLGSILFSTFTLWSHWDGALRSLDFRMLKVAYSAAYFIGAEYHEKFLQASSQVDFEDHRKTSLILADMAEKMSVRKVYAMVMKDNKVYVSASSVNKANLKPEPYDPFKHEQAYVSDLTKSAFAGDQPLYEYGRDNTGAFRSAFLPLKTASGKAFIIAVDFPMESIQNRLYGLIIQYGVQGLVFFLIPFILLFVLLSQASRHLNQLSLFTRTLIDRNFSPDPDILRGLEQIARDHPDEIGQISSSLANMHSALQKHIRELEKATSSREKMESEMRIASDIQRNILPKAFPPHYLTGKAEMFATLQPAQGVGGDFFDFSPLDNDRLLLLAGDVSGKGIPASLFMAVTTTLLKTYGKQGLSPEDILRSTNRDLCQDNEQAMFATVFCGILDLSSGHLRYAVAGHNPPILTGSSGTRVLPTGGIALGVSDRPDFHVGTAVLQPADALLLYTDGVPEAIDAQLGFFSEDRMLQVVEGCRDKSPYSLVTTLSEEVRRFSQGVAQADDIMMMAVRLFTRGDNSFADLPILFSLKNSLDEYPRMNKFFEGFWEAHALPSGKRPDFMVVLDESVSNIIRHAFPDGGEHEITIRAGIVGGALILEVQDSGLTFNPRNYFRPPSSGKGDKEGGWGIFLIRKMVDSIDYQRVGNKNILRMTMAIPAKKGLEIELRGAEPMEIIEKTTDSIITLAISGRIDTQTAVDLDRALDNVLTRGFLKIILDFSSLDYITSGGLRVLLQYSKKVQPQGGTMALAAMKPEVKKIFQLTGFLNIFHHFGTLEDAIEKLRETS